MKLHWKTVADLIERSRQAREEAVPEPPKQPDAVDLYIRQYLDPDVLRQALDAAVRDALQDEITKTAGLIAQKFLYETEQGKAAIREADELLRRYPAIDYSVIEQLKGAIGEVIYGHFANDRSKRPLSDG